MTGDTHHDGRIGRHDESDRHDDSGSGTLSDPETLRGRDGVPFDGETAVHDDREHCSADVAGRSVVGARNDDGETLLLVNPELSVALLPHGTVAPGEDWAATARREAEGQTGVSIELDGVEAVREVDHVVDGQDEPHARTFRVVFRASPVGGAIRECKRTAAAGSDGWTAGWFDDLPEGVAAPDWRVEDDLRPFLGS